MVRIGFITCVQLGLSCMEAIYDAGGSLVFAMTLEDEQAKNKSGRVYIDDFCNKHGIYLHKSTHVNNDDVIKAIKSRELDWLFIVGWSQIASKELLEAPKKGALGIHPTLLPEGRGRAAIPWAIIKGLNKTGVTLFKLDEGVDTGQIVDQVEILLDDQTTATDLYSEVNKAHIQLIKKAIPHLMRNDLRLILQDESKATEWPGRRPEDGEINLRGSVIDAERMVRALTRPYPGAFYYDQEGNKVVIWECEFADSNSDNCLIFHDGYLKIIKSKVIKDGS